MKIATIDLLRSLIEVRDAFDESPLPLSIMLLSAALKQGSSVSDIGKAVRAPRTDYFRQLQRLGTGDHTGPGLNLVAALPHADGRSNAIYLTKAGERVVERLRSGTKSPLGIRTR